MTKRQANSQNPPPQRHYPPGPSPRRGGDTLSIFTLVGVVVVLMISFANWREIDGIQKSLDTRLAQLDAKMAQIQTRPAVAPAPAQQARRGPDPNRVYQIKTNGRPSKGPARAAVTIVEFSDFQ
jgi:hypothetical protein